MRPSATPTASAIPDWRGPAALRIVAGVVAFRLRNLEMVNLAGAVSIALALRLPWPEVLYRAGFAFLLNVFVYLNNDYLDAEDDLKAEARNTRQTAFLVEHMDAALAVQWALVGLLVVAALAFDASLLAALVFGGGTCVLYSARLKRVPVLDVAAMAVWGLSMPLCGFPLGNPLGLCLALQLGGFAAVYEAIQVLRDARQDAAAGIRTTAVVLGPARTRWLSRGLMLLVAIFAALVLHPIAALIAAGALLVPLEGADIERRWTVVKIIYAAAWLLVCGWIFSTGGSAGLVWSIAASSAGS